MTEKIQFFMSDLAYKLEVGEIKEIHVAEQNGRKVLRLECEKMETSEYKTVHASKSAKTIVPKKREQPEGKPKSFTEKVAAGAADFFLNPERNKGKFGGGFG